MEESRPGDRVIAARGAAHGQIGDVVEIVRTAGEAEQLWVRWVKPHVRMDDTELLPARNFDRLDVTTSQRIFQPGDRVRFNENSTAMVMCDAEFVRYEDGGYSIVIVKGAEYRTPTYTLDYIPPDETLARDYVAGDRIRVTSGKSKHQFGLVLEVRRHTLSVMLDDADLGMDFTKHDVEIAPDTRQAKSVQSRYSAGDVVFLTSDRRCDVPMTVTSAIGADAVLVAWLDPARQMQTFMAHEDSFARAAEIRRRLDGDDFAKVRHEMPRGY